MRKKIKQIGNSKGIIFAKEECEVYKLKIDDIIDVNVKKVKK